MIEENISPDLKRVKIKRNKLKEDWLGYLFISPMVIGVIIFTIYPILSSIYYSFFTVNLINPPYDFGIKNYVSIFSGTESHFFWLTLKNTFLYVIIEVPLSMVLSYLLALMLVKNSTKVYVLRVLFYIPVLIPSVVSGMVWKDIVDPNYGILRGIFVDGLGLDPLNLFERNYALMSFIGIRMFDIGGGMIIWIAAFKAIPMMYYEAAEIDGASKTDSFFKITLPLSTSSIFYNLIVGIIGAFQVFGTPYVLVGNKGGDGNSLYFTVMHIYNKAFDELNFGVAAAMSWVLFAIIGILTFINFKTKKWVYYSEEN